MNEIRYLLFSFIFFRVLSTKEMPLFITVAGLGRHFRIRIKL